MAVQQADFPVRDELVDAERKVTERWRIWLRNLRADVDKRSSILASVTKTGQTLSLTATPFLTDTLVGGMYRVSAFTHITTVASVNISLIVTITFTHNSTACSIASAALTTNLTTGVQSNVWSIAVDPGTPVNYSTTFVPNAVGTGAYSVNMALETVNS